MLMGVLFRSRQSARSWVRIFDVMWVCELRGCRRHPEAACAHLLPSALWGSPGFHFIHKGTWGISSFWAPNNPRSRCWRGKPHLLLSFVPRPNKTRKVFLFWEKQFILDSCFLPHLGRWDNLNAVLSALTLEFLAAKLKKINSKKHPPPPFPYQRAPGSSWKPLSLSWQCLSHILSQNGEKISYKKRKYYHDRNLKLTHW